MMSGLIAMCLKHLGHYQAHTRAHDTFNDYLNNLKYLKKFILVKKKNSRYKIDKNKNILF